MGACYALAYLLIFIDDSAHALSELAQVFFGIGFGVAAYGLGKAVKQNGDLYVANEAEMRRHSAVLPTDTSIPQIQREIDLQRAGTSKVATKESANVRPLTI